MPQREGKMGSESSELLDVPEGANAYHVTQSTVRSWILNKKIPYVKLGRRVFLRRKDVEAFIERSVVPAREAR